MKTLLIAMLLICPVPVLASGLFVEGHGGVLLGFGAEAGMEFGMVRARAQVNRLDYNTTEDLDNEPYDVSLKLDSKGVLVDLFPFDGSFHVTAGLYDNNNAVHANSERPVSINGSLLKHNASADVSFSGSAGYVGLGWVFGRHNKGVTGNLELGVMGNGGASVDLMVQSPHPDISDSDIRAEEKKIEDDINKYEYLPVIKFGIGYYF